MSKGIPGLLGTWERKSYHARPERRTKKGAAREMAGRKREGGKTGTNGVHLSEEEGNLNEA